MPLNLSMLRGFWTNARSIAIGFCFCLCVRVCRSKCFVFDHGYAPISLDRVYHGVVPPYYRAHEHVSFTCSGFTTYSFYWSSDSTKVVVSLDGGPSWPNLTPSVWNSRIVTGCDYSRTYTFDVFNMGHSAATLWNKLGAIREDPTASTTAAPSISPATLSPTTTPMSSSPTQSSAVWPSAAPTAGHSNIFLWISLLINFSFSFSFIWWRISTHPGNEELIGIPQLATETPLRRFWHFLKFVMLLSLAPLDFCSDVVFCVDMHLSGQGKWLRATSTTFVALPLLVNIIALIYSKHQANHGWNMRWATTNRALTGGLILLSCIEPRCWVLLPWATLDLQAERGFPSRILLHFGWLKLIVEDIPMLIITSTSIGISKSNGSLLVSEMSIATTVLSILYYTCPHNSHTGIDVPVATIVAETDTDESNIPITTHLVTVNATNEATPLRNHLGPGYNQGAS